jgi:hypothetical protein
LLRNWKPLRLDQVCDTPHKTVGDIFNDLTNHATLRVLVRRYVPLLCCLSVFSFQTQLIMGNAALIKGVVVVTNICVIMALLVTSLTSDIGG